jgi:hypothetical protein
VRVFKLDSSSHNHRIFITCRKAYRLTITTIDFMFGNFGPIRLLRVSIFSSLESHRHGKDILRHNGRPHKLKRSNNLNSIYSTTAIHSISTSTFLGNVLTATQLLAGFGFPNALIVSPSQIPVIPAHKLHSYLQSPSYLQGKH